MYIAALDITLYIFITFSSILVKIKKKELVVMKWTCFKTLHIYLLNKA